MKQLILLVDQLMCVKYVLWRRSIFNRERAIFLSVILISIFFFVNVHLNFTVKYSVKDGNSTSFIDLITSSQVLVFWLKVSLKLFILVQIYNFIFGRLTF